MLAPAAEPKSILEAALQRRRLDRVRSHQTSGSAIQATASQGGTWLADIPMTSSPANHRAAKRHPIVGNGYHRGALGIGGASFADCPVLCDHDSHALGNPLPPFNAGGATASRANSAGCYGIQA